MSSRVAFACFLGFVSFGTAAAQEETREPPGVAVQLSDADKAYWLRYGPEKGQTLASRMTRVALVHCPMKVHKVIAPLLRERFAALERSSNPDVRAWLEHLQTPGVHGDAGRATRPLRTLRLPGTLSRVVDKLTRSLGLPGDTPLPRLKQICEGSPKPENKPPRKRKDKDAGKEGEALRSKAFAEERTLGQRIDKLASAAGIEKTSAEALKYCDSKKVPPKNQPLCAAVRRAFSAYRKAALKALGNVGAAFEQSKRTCQDLLAALGKLTPEDWQKYAIRVTQAFNKTMKNIADLSERERKEEEQRLKREKKKGTKPKTSSEPGDDPDAAAPLAPKDKGRCFAIVASGAYVPGGHISDRKVVSAFLAKLRAMELEHKTQKSDEEIAELSALRAKHASSMPTDADRANAEELQRVGAKVAEIRCDARCQALKREIEDTKAELARVGKLSKKERRALCKKDPTLCPSTLEARVRKAKGELQSRPVGVLVTAQARTIGHETGRGKEDLEKLRVALAAAERTAEEARQGFERVRADALRRVEEKLRGPGLTEKQRVALEQRKTDLERVGQGVDPKLERASRRYREAQAKAQAARERIEAARAQASDDATASDARVGRIAAGEKRRAKRELRAAERTTTRAERDARDARAPLAKVVCERRGNPSCQEYRDTQKTIRAAERGAEAARRAVRLKSPSMIVTNHAFGLAFDIDDPHKRHPPCTQSNKHLPCRVPPAAVRVLEEGGTFKWLSNDASHFQWNKPVSGRP